VTLRCHACKKPLLRFAVSNIGADGVEYGFGPVCAKPFLIRQRTTTPRAVVRSHRPAYDTRQVDWLRELEQLHAY